MEHISTKFLELDDFLPSAASSNSTSSISTDQDNHSEAASISESSNNSTVINQFITQQYQFNLQDIEKTIGFLDENTDIIKWFNDFIDYSKLFNWNDLQKFIIVKKLLIGLPKLFIENEGLNISTWPELKNSLINEFSIKLNAYQLHKMLSERKLNENESFYEYFLKMKDIASKGTIDFESFVNYIINGIPDDVQMKYLLYDVKTMHELKEKIKIMSKFQHKLLLENRNGKKKISVEKQQQQELVNEMWENNENENIVTLNNLCLICGENGHDRNNCPLKNNQGIPQNNNQGIPHNINGLSQENIQQISALILPYFTNTMDELKDRLKANSDKLTNTKIEVERLTEITSRHTISLANHEKRLQTVEDNQKTMAGFLAGSQLKDSIKTVNDNNLLKADKKQSQTEKKKVNFKKSLSTETDESEIYESDNSSTDSNSSVKKSSSDNNSSVKKSSSDNNSSVKKSSSNNSSSNNNSSQNNDLPLMDLMQGFAQFLSKLDL